VYKYLTYYRYIFKQFKLKYSRTTLFYEIAPKQNSTSVSIANTAQEITGNKGGYVVIRDADEDDYPDEILIMNAADVKHSTKVWRWNKGGLGYASGDTPYDSSTGRYVYEDDDKYSLAITQDGKINASFIQTGTLNADLIQTGSIDAEEVTIKNLSASSITTGTLRTNSGTLSINLDNNYLSLGGYGQGLYINRYGSIGAYGSVYNGSYATSGLFKGDTGYFDLASSWVVGFPGPGPIFVIKWHRVWFVNGLFIGVSDGYGQSEKDETWSYSGVPSTWNGNY